MKTPIPGLLFSVLILASACSSNPKHAEDVLYYETVSIENKCRLSIGNITTQADSTGTLYIKLSLRNPSATPAEIRPSDFVLETPDGLRSNPINQDTALLIAGQWKQVDLVFRPTNSLKIFRLTGLPGDLLTQYHLSNPAIQLHASFTAYPDDFATHEKWGIEKNLGIFRLSDQEDFIEMETAYLNRVLNQDEVSRHHGVLATEQEILIDGLNLRLQVFTLQDTLHVTLWMTNHSPYVITVSPEAMEVFTETTTWQPVSPASPVEIPRSQRYRLELRYAPFEEDAFDLNVASMIFNHHESTSVFHAPSLHLVKQDSTL
jgi:hypothetical protein